MRVLLAVLHCGEDAYGVTVVREIESRTGKALSRGAVYVTLERLEKKGLLASRLGEASAVRGGRAKRLFSVKPLGLRILRQSLSELARLQDGLELVLSKP